MNSEDAFRILNAVPGVGPVTLNRLLRAFDNDPVAVLRGDEKRITAVKSVGTTLSDQLAHWSQAIDLEKENRSLASLGARWISRNDTCFPALLNELPDPPAGLYVRGEHGVSSRAIAIVGTRRPTLYGRETAHKLAQQLASLGFWIVSGGARGIDTAAHNGALSVGGKTAAIFGCGLDIVYPPENLDLFRKIAETGAIYSEFPIGRKADKQTFPQRNRLISGMTLATIVIESGTHGGSMLTANFAADQGRHVFAVPGRIDQPASQGCHRLIREGATLLTGVDDVLEALHENGVELPLAQASASPTSGGQLPMQNTLSPAEQAVLTVLADGAQRGSDDIALHTGLGTAACNTALMLLELKRALVKYPDGRYEARRQ